ncbi:MAG: hypothetical protein ACT4P7_17350 [Gemmatimonadaceae bacterium]
MSDLTRLEETWRRLLDANMRYYEAVGAIARDYMSAMTSAWRDAIPPLTLRVPTATPHGPGPGPGRSNPSPAPASTPALVLEAPAGQEARAAFAVFNDLSREISAPITVSPLRDDTGAEARPALRLHPGLLTLPPGARGVVEVHAAIDDTLAPDVGYYGTITVPDLTTGKIAVVVRRLTSAAAAAPPAPRSRNPRKQRAPSRRH